MPSVTARSLGVIMWCLSLVLQPSATLASEQQAKASSEQQTKNPNAPPAFNESVQPPGASGAGLGKKPVASPSVAVSRKEEAWHTLETACTGDKATDRANAMSGTAETQVKGEKPIQLGPGSFLSVLPRHVMNFACAQECTLFVYTDGPFALHYVDEGVNEISPTTALQKK